ncbi:E3 ubiquitin-protein ligase RHF1A [Ricinus communis]|uniref:E3 ubiquitin-protein ligase RHF1A n=1 Tax=Ricinus communis TaxID=3988 RepID=UPI00077289BF|nr:E3 ubiquitin-protein ligase RHF1A [Ricinus communis]|eukprot:XP_015573543.1 E3 ubiquitin-protein ligase RHF1A [Ricinus communis]
MSATFSSSSSSPSSLLLSDPPFFSASASAVVVADADGAGGSSGAILVDSFEDCCSICLEPFTSQNPSTVTSCKHEYHLQCILEWSQRSKECPICWQLLVLQEPACQELLAAVETERRLRSRNTPSAAFSNPTRFHEDIDVEQDSYSDDSDFDERIMQHLAAVASRARYICRRERQRSSGQGPSRALIFPSPTNEPSAQQTHTSAVEGQDVYYGSSRGNSATSLLESQSLPSVDTAVSKDVSSKPRVFLRPPSTVAPQTSSEGLSFSESMKSKWVAASSRYKESISKSTQGIKEKLLARNNSVKELSRGVQREMSAGIAGVARMFERLDLTPKRTGASSPVSGCREGTSELSLKGKGMQENTILQALNKKSEEVPCAASMDVPLHVSYNVQGRVEVHHEQRDH